MNTISIIIISASYAVFVGIIVVLCIIRRRDRKRLTAASETICRYLKGDTQARLDCRDEDSYAVLFHDVNSLISTLGAQADYAAEAKEYLKNSIQDISHQLKTPLSSLSLYNEILQDESLDKDSVRKFLNLSAGELNRMESLISMLLKLTKLDAKNVVLSKEDIAVNELAESVCGHFRIRAEQENKKLGVECCDDGLCVFCDKQWITEALDNIVKNALDHTDSGGRVELRAMRSGNEACIQISDNGRGIHEEDIYHIFKRFYRSRFSSDKSGTGLGLSLAKSIIELHKGSIEVESAPNEGACFSVYLPLSDNFVG